MGLRKSNSKNWDILKKQDYKERVKNREVHATQAMERGERGAVDKPIKERVLALFVAGIFALLGFLVGCIGMVVWGFFNS